MHWGGWEGTSRGKNNKRTSGITIPQTKKFCFSAVPQSKGLFFQGETTSI